MPAAKNETIARAILLVMGVMCGSTAVIMIKASTEHPFLLSSYRLLLAGLVLLPFFVRELRKSPGKYGWRELGWSALPALGLAVHFMSWVFGARMTPVANASLIANLTPAAMPFFLWLFYRERVKKVELIGTAFTIMGLLVLTGANLQLSHENVLGDLICFGSMLAFAAYLALGRKNGSRLSLWLYMVPLYLMAGVICFVAALFVTNPFKETTLLNVLYIIGLALVPTVGGHTILNYSMKFFRGQVVSVTNLSQPVFAGILGFLIFHEIPRPVFFAAAALVVAGVLIVLNSAWLETHLARPFELSKSVE